MFSLSANPEYIPGGIQNFWTTTPPATGGVAVETSSVTAAPAQESSSFAAWFFVNSKMAESTREEGQKMPALGEKKVRVESGYLREKMDITKLFFFNQNSLRL